MFADYSIKSRLTSSGSTRYFVCYLLSGFVAIIDLFIVFLFIPVSETILFSQSSDYSAFTKWEHSHFSPANKSDELLISLMFLLAASVFRILWHFLFRYQEFIFKKKLIDRTAQRLFESFYSSPFLVHSKSKSSDWIRSINDIENVVNYDIGVRFVIFYDLITLLGILVYVLNRSFIVVLVTIAINFAFLFPLQKIFRKRMAILSKEKFDSESSRIQIISELFKGFRELRVYRKIDFAIKEFSSVQVRASRDQESILIGNLIPVFYEFLAIFMLFSIVGFSILFGNEQQDTFSLLGILAISILRAVPSSSRIFASIQRKRAVRDSSLNLRRMISELNDANQEETFSVNPLFNSWCEIAISDLAFRYPNQTEYAFCDLNLRISKGQKIGIFGASGSGKSTFINIFLGLITGYSGSIQIDGTNINPDDSGFYKTLGFVPQDIFLMNTTILENITFENSYENCNVDLLSSVINASRLNEVISQLPNGLLTPIGENGSNFSGGEKQRIGIARALYRQPSILILDETTSGLDFSMEKNLLEAIIEENSDLTLILVSHRQNSFKNFDQILEFKAN